MDRSRKTLGEEWNEFLKTNSSAPNEIRNSDGLWVYRNNYINSHIESLVRNFPIVLKVIGDDGFKFFSYQYLISRKVTDPNIDKFGGEFSLFLGEREELSNIPFIKYLAEIDQLWFDSDLTKSIEVPKGSLDLYSQISESIIPSVEIDPSKTERISVKYIDGSLNFTIVD
jgi:hypothetical protein